MIYTEDTVVLTGADLAQFLRDLDEARATSPPPRLTGPGPSPAYQQRIAAARAAMETP